MSANSPGFEHEDSEPKNMRRARWREVLSRLIPIVFYSSLAIFLVVFFVSVDYNSLADLRINVWILIVAVIVGLANRFWLVLIWLVILRGLGATRPRSLTEMAHVYAKSWLGRYIPGTAPWILGKIYFASRQGVSKTKLAVSSLMEGGVQLLVQLLVGLLLLVMDARVRETVGPVWPVLVVAAAVSAVLLHPAVFSAALSVMHRIVKRRPLDPEHRPAWGVMLRATALYVGAAVLGGLAAYFVALSIVPDLSGFDAIFIIAALNLASAVSMLAVFAPSGLGVREVILIALFSLVMPLEVAVVASIVLRLWSIATDFLFVGMTQAAVLVQRRRR